jgi:hypothetical protein
VGRTDLDGTFAIVPSAPAESLEVRCAYCRTERVELDGRSNLALVVRRYAALESDVPSAADLAALPYGRIVDDLALVPFAIPTAGGADISDRGLGDGHGLVLDNGAPLVDLATGQSSLADFPDRYVHDVSVVSPTQAFRYGSYAGGGVFALYPNREQSSFGSVDASGAPSFALEPVLGNVRPSFGASSDDGVLARRADVATTTGFGGGTLDAGMGSAAENLPAQFGLGAFSRSLDMAHVDYATASRLYRSFVDFSAANDLLSDDLLGGDTYRSSYLAADVRIEHPGPVSLAFGALTTRQTAIYALPAAPYSVLTGRAYDETVYLEAQTGTQSYGVHAGLGLSNITAYETLTAARISGERLAVLPSITGALPLGGGLYARAGFSEAIREPTLLEANAQPAPPPNVAPLEREELTEGAVGFDNGARVRTELVAYRQFTHGFDEQRFSGLGASVVWQVAPLISLRGWTLRANPVDYTTSLQPLLENDISRQVLWATYANGDGLRFDAILQRDPRTAGSGFPVDGDVYVPVLPDAALSLGSASVSGVRHFFIGLRTR